MSRRRMSPVINYGGIGGSGIFGMFGTTVRCDSKDDSYYCILAKIVNTLIMIFVLGFILYFIYTFFFRNYSNKIRGGGFGKR